MDFRHIADFLEERRQDKQPFTIYYARIGKKTNEIICKDFKVQIRDTFGWPIIEPVDKKQAKENGYTNIRIQDGRDNKISDKIDPNPRAIGRTREEALINLKNSLEYKIKLRTEEINNCKRIIDESEQTLKMIEKFMATE